MAGKVEENYPRSQDAVSMHAMGANSDEIGAKAGLVSAISDNRSLLTGFRDEDPMFTNSPNTTLVPTVETDGHRYSMGHAELNLGDFGTEQCVVEVEDFFARQGNVKAERWLDMLPSTAFAATANVASSRSSSSFDRRGAWRSYSLEDDDNMLAGRTTASLFREVPGGPWELRHAAEVEAEAQRRRSSQSSWHSDEGPSYRYARFDDIDWAVVDELKEFNFTEQPCRGRARTRPDFPPWSPRAVGCKLWPELPDFSIPLEQEDIFHSHVTAQPAPGPMDEILPARDEESQVSCRRKPSG